MKKTSSTERVRNAVRVKEETNILHAINSRKANWIGCILRRNCLLISLLKKRWRKDRSEEKNKRKTYATTV